MRPGDIKRELERLTVDASQARAQLAEVRGKLSEARAMIGDIRGALRGAGAEVDAEGTPGTGAAQVAQGDA
jgi:hypothetical protein